MTLPCKLLMQTLCPAVIEISVHILMAEPDTELYISKGRNSIEQPFAKEKAGR